MHTARVETPSNEAWLVAVWPGMGAVAQIAGTYLVGNLGARPVAELDARPSYAPDSISVRAGIVPPARLPRSVLHAWRDPAEGREPVGPETVPAEVAERIETLFARAQDRSAALQLKAELDQRGHFQRYEDRFLDLFKQAG